MVEQEAVNFKVASSNLAGGAIFCTKNFKKLDVGPSVRIWPGEPFFVVRNYDDGWEMWYNGVMTGEYEFDYDEDRDGFDGDEGDASFDEEDIEEDDYDDE